MTPKNPTYTRPDLDIIVTLIKENSSVLDLGCGSGDLLKRLMVEKRVRGHGVEIFDKYVWPILDSHDGHVYSACYDLHKRLKSFFELYKMRVG